MPEAVRERIAVFGLGIIGSIWAQAYEEAGVLAATWNRSERRDIPRFTEDPAAAAAAATVVHCCVADTAAVLQVLAALAPGLRPGTLVVQSSTIDPEGSRQARTAVESMGGLYLEAPFTGSKPAAEARKLVFYISGAEAMRTRAEPVLALLSEVRLVCGEHAEAAALKLAMNLNIAIQMHALAESLTFARRSGISDDLYFAGLRRNVSHSGLAALKETKLRTGNFSTQFSVKHMLKDLGLALGDPAGADFVLTDVARKRLGEAASAGWADEDFAAVIRLLQQRAG